MRKFNLTSTLAAMGLTIALGLGIYAPKVQASIDGAKWTAVEMATVMETYGYRFSDVEAQFLRRGTYDLVEAQLSANRSYAFVASGDEDARDVDITVYNRNGDVLVRDDSYDRTAVAYIDAYRNTKVYVKVTMHDSSRRGAYYVLLLGEKR